MPRPIVIAHHLIWTAYGWWLPNDPRGSTSRAVASDVIAELGELHFGRRKVQPPTDIIRQFHDRAREVLKYPSVWATSGWKGFLDHPDEVRRTVRYIEDNPRKWRLPEQRWPFVKQYDGWPLHPGHSPNSPYARRMRGRDRAEG
jgi:hypothetical protein